MKSIKYLAFPLLSAALVMTGCASRKPATTATTGTTNPSTVNTTGLSEDAALNAQNLAGASSKGVTEANKAALAKRVVHFDYDSSDLSTEDYQTLPGSCSVPHGKCKLKSCINWSYRRARYTRIQHGLGERRAKAVQNYLITSGVNPQQLEAVSYGKEAPVNPAMMNQLGKKTALKLTMKRFLLY